MRVGTTTPDRKVFANLRRLVVEIQSKNGGRSITDADREAIAEHLGVKVDAVKRMEPRIFVSDVVVSQTDSLADGDGEHMITACSVIAVEGGQSEVDVAMDQRKIMSRIMAIVQSTFEDRDLEIVQARLAGDMTREKFDTLVSKYQIGVERIRQIQRSALQTIREHLQRDGITGLDMIAC